MQNNKIELLRKEFAQKNTVLAGLVIRCPLSVFDELRLFLKQSVNTQIHFSAVSMEPKAIMHLSCDKPAISIDPEK
jgi:hypothetical protein